MRVVYTFDAPEDFDAFRDIVRCLVGCLLLLKRHDPAATLFITHKEDPPE